MFLTSIRDYPWNKLVSPVVDVGGGIGSLEMMLLKDEKNASLRFVIFDIPETIENAKKVCDRALFRIFVQ